MNTLLLKQSLKTGFLLFFFAIFYTNTSLIAKENKLRAGGLCQENCQFQIPNPLLKEIRQKRYWEMPVWQKLFHAQYSASKKTIESDVISSNFFLSDSRNLKEELFLILKALLTQNREVVCRFPARSIWLKRKLAHHPSSPDLPNCQKFKKWAGIDSIISLEVLFSGSEPNNPATMFGHPLLRIKRNYKHGIKALSILDEAIGFAADLNGQPINGFKGIFGLYKSNYQIRDFHHYQTMYGTLEGRDLWSYEIKLTKDQKTLLLAHLWELEPSVHFDYYFFKDNCSYRIAEILDLLFPKAQFSNTFSPFYIPRILIQKLVDQSENGLLAISSKNYYPSLPTKISRSLAKLSVDDQETILQQAMSKDISHVKDYLKVHPEKISLGWLSILMNMVKSELILKKEDQDQNEDFWKELVEFRADYPVKKQPIDIKPNGFPHEHPAPSRIALSLRGEYIGFQYDLFEHSLTGGSTGDYQTHSQIRLLNFNFERHETETVLQKATFIEYIRIPEHSLFSGQGNLAYGNLSLTYHHADRFRTNQGWIASTGLTWNLFDLDSSDSYLFALTNIYLREEKTVPGNFVSGGQLSIGAIFHPWAHTGIRLQYKEFHDDSTLGNYSSEMEWNTHFNQYWGVKVLLSHFKTSTFKGEIFYRW